MDVGKAAAVALVFSWAIYGQKAVRKPLPKCVSWGEGTLGGGGAYGPLSAGKQTVSDPPYSLTFGTGRPPGCRW